jgi:magnesium transporter
VRLMDTQSVGEALSELRGGNLGERIVYFYVTGAEGKLVGVVPTRRLLLSDLSTPIRDLMVHPVVSVTASEPFGRALETLAARKLLALPVVDDSGRLTGILDASTFTETLIDLERRESAEELFQLAGIHIEQERSRSAVWVLGKRLPWLLCNVASGLVAALIAASCDALLRSVVALAFFVPLLLTIAESVAMQSLTASLNRLQAAGRLATAGGALRELRVGVLLGLANGAMAGSIAVVWLGLYEVAAVVAASVLFVGTAGAGLGYAIPRLVRHWRLNPTIASGPLTLALTDIAALAFYFGLAAALLG